MRARPAALLAVSLMVSAAYTPPAGADETADEADFRFRRAAALYGKGHLEEALGEFYASNRLVRNKNVTFNIARCLEQLGDLNEAYRYYNDLLAEPWAPDDRAALEQNLARLRPRVALVRVETVPPGAQVFIEREDLGSRGETPKVLALPVGPAKVLVRLDGHRTAERTITLEKGHESTVKVDLEFIYGFVELAVDPAGTQVRLGTVDAPVACAAPCTLQVAPGLVVLHLSAPEHEPLRRELVVAPDARVPLAVRLEVKRPPKGSLVVTANRDGALVTVDGLEAGFTPVVVPDIPIGEHTVEVSYPELETFRRVVAVEEGRSASVRARLSVPAPKVAAATKTLTSVDDAAASVTVITRDEIRAFGYQSLAQALQAVRGVYVSNDRNYEFTGVRGFAPPGDFNTRVTVLIDGHPMNEIWAGSAAIAGDNDVDLAEVERIEVLRGPNSVLYGSSAVYGVINVVRRQRPANGAVEASVTSGSRGTLRTRATAGAGGEDWAIKTTAAIQRVGGAESTQLHMYPDEAPLPLVLGLDHEQSAHASFFGKIGGLSLVGYFNDRARSLPTGPFEAVYGAPGTGSRETRGFAELRYEKALAAWELTSRAYWDTYRYMGAWIYERAGGGVGPQEDLGRGEWTGAELRLRTPVFFGQTVTFGAEGQAWLSVRQETFVRGEPPIQAKEGRYAAYNGSLLWDGKFGERLSAEAGLRIDSVPRLREPVLAPRLALLGRPYDGGRTKLLFGRAFRAPNLVERDYHDGGISQIVAGELSSEIITSAELEHTHRFGDELTATVSLWASDLENRIVLKNVGGTGDDRDKLQYQNEGHVRAAGAEAEVRWQPSRLTLVSFSWAFQYSRDAAQFLTAAPLVNSPANLAALRIMAPLHALATLGVEGTYGSARWTRGRLRDGVVVDRLPVGEALLVNGALSGELVKDRLRYALVVRNLLDQQYAYPAGDEFLVQTIPQYGRQLLVTLSGSL